MKIVLDGNIGCGKSSLLNKLKDYISLNFYNEPLDVWSDWLKLFYSNMSKHAFGFQMRVLKTHMGYKKINDGVFERSPISCQHVFGQLLYDDLYMNQSEWKLTNEFNQDYGWVPDVIIYLQCPPEICAERIRQRKNNEEISSSYLEKVHQKYEELYIENKLKFNVITIDATQNIDLIFNNIKNIIESYLLYN